VQKPKRYKPLRQHAIVARDFSQRVFRAECAECVVASEEPVFPDDDDDDDRWFLVILSRFLVILKLNPFWTARLLDCQYILQ
jgi:hypothetical protein